MRFLPKSKFTWVLLIILAYAYFNAYVIEKPASSKRETEISVHASNEEKGSLLERPLNALVKQLQKTATGEAVVKAVVEQSIKQKYGDKEISIISAQEGDKIVTLDTAQGEGKTVGCGSTVTLGYEAFTENRLKFDSGTVTFKTGDGKVIKGLENGVFGMKKGGKRKIAIASRLAYDDANFKNDLVGANSPVLFEVELTDLKNGFGVLPVMAIEPLSEGEGNDEALCGSAVSINYKLMDGGEVKDSGSLNFKIGGTGVPPGLEKGVMNMQIGAVRRLTIPVELMKTGAKSVLPESVKLPDSGKVVLEVELTGIG